MGNTEQTKKSQIVDIQLSHPKFTNSKLVKYSNQIHVQTSLLCEQKQYKKWLEQLTANTSQNQHLFLPLLQSFSSKNLCGSSGNAILNYPYFPYLLSQEIYNRLGRKTKFQETDLWYLLYSLSAAQQQAKNFTQLKNVGDIRTSNVFLNDEGKVKVGCMLSWPNQVRVWQKALQKESVYLSPEQFQRLSRGEAQSQSLQNLAQSFAIGLTMLNSGLLIDDSTVPTLYDFKTEKFNHTEYNRRINEWIMARGYSDILKAIVLNLVQLIPQSRLTGQELWDLIGGHDKQIKARENFVITNAPNKVHQHVLKYRQLKSRGGISGIPFSNENVLNNLGSINSYKPAQLLQTSTVVKHEISSNNIGFNLGDTGIPQPPTILDPSEILKKFNLEPVGTISQQQVSTQLNKPSQQQNNTKPEESKEPVNQPN